MKTKLGLLTGGILLLSAAVCPLHALESTFAGNYIVPEHQSGYNAEAYEVEAGRKFQRGAENFFLGWLEIPHGVKSEWYYRKQEYLDPTFESFFVGLGKGTLNAAGRTGVGLYEIFTALYPQDPILPEMSEWLY